MRAMERFKSWYKKTTGTENAHSDGSVHSGEGIVSCTCLPRSKSSGVYEMRKATGADAAALADIKARNRSGNQNQKGIISKVLVVVVAAVVAAVVDFHFLLALHFATSLCVFVCSLYCCTGENSSLTVLALSIFGAGCVHCVARICTSQGADTDSRRVFCLLHPRNTCRGRLWTPATSLPTTAKRIVTL